MSVYNYIDIHHELKKVQDGQRVYSKMGLKSDIAIKNSEYIEALITSCKYLENKVEELEYRIFELENA